MPSEKQPALPNRQTPFSDAFREFICADWADYDPNPPAAIPGAIAAAAHRDLLSARYPGERLIVPAGGFKTRSNDTDYRFRPHSAFTWLTGLGTDIILLGTGSRLRFPSGALLRPFANAGIGLDVMDLQAACRTYNILAGEGRNVIAALLLEQPVQQG